MTNGQPHNTHTYLSHTYLSHYLNVTLYHLFHGTISLYSMSQCLDMLQHLLKNDLNSLLQKMVRNGMCFLDLRFISIFIHRTWPPESFSRDRPKSIAICYTGIKSSYFIFEWLTNVLLDYYPFPLRDVGDANKSDNSAEAEAHITFLHTIHFQTCSNKVLGPMERL